MPEGPLGAPRPLGVGPLVKRQAASHLTLAFTRPSDDRLRKTVGLGLQDSLDRVGVVGDPKDGDRYRYPVPGDRIDQGAIGELSSRLRNGRLGRHFADYFEDVFSDTEEVNGFTRDEAAGRGFVPFMAVVPDEGWQLAIEVNRERAVPEGQVTPPASDRELWREIREAFTAHFPDDAVEVRDESLVVIVPDDIHPIHHVVTKVRPEARVSGGGITYTVFNL